MCVHVCMYACACVFVVIEESMQLMYVDEI